jgi:hypothetical protein
MLRWSSSAAAVVAAGGGGGEAAATRLLGEFLTWDLRTLCIGPHVAKKVEGFIRRAMETTAATATACGGDDGGDDNDDNFTIAMVINLDLRTAGVRWYIARLNLTGGMAVSLFFQGDDGSNTPNECYVL